METVVPCVGDWRIAAFSCAASPLALLWGSPGLTLSHAPVRTLLRVWKFLEKSVQGYMGESLAV